MQKHFAWGEARGVWGPCRINTKIGHPQRANTNPHPQTKNMVRIPALADERVKYAGCFSYKWLKPRSKKLSCPFRSPKNDCRLSLHRIVCFLLTCRVRGPLTGYQRGRVFGRGGGRRGGAGRRRGPEVFRSFKSNRPWVESTQECADKLLFYDATEINLRFQGNRHHLFFVDDPELPPFIGKDNMVCWARGAYKLHYTKGRLAVVIHRPTNEEVVLDDDEFYDNSWELDGNWSDLQAKLFKSTTRKKYLHEFFAKNKGPHRPGRLTGKGLVFQQFVQEAKANRPVAPAAVAAPSDDAAKTFLAPDKSDDHAEARAKAAAALAARVESRAKKRRVSFVRRRSSNEGKDPPPVKTRATPADADSVLEPGGLNSSASGATG